MGTQLMIWRTLSTTTDGKIKFLKGEIRYEYQ